MLGDPASPFPSLLSDGAPAVAHSPFPFSLAALDDHNLKHKRASTTSPLQDYEVDGAGTSLSFFWATARSITAQTLIIATPLVVAWPDLIVQDCPTTPTNASCRARLGRPYI